MYDMIVWYSFAVLLHWILRPRVLRTPTLFQTIKIHSFFFFPPLFSFLLYADFDESIHVICPREGPLPNFSRDFGPRKMDIFLDAFLGQVLGWWLFWLFLGCRFSSMYGHATLDAYVMKSKYMLPQKGGESEGVHTCFYQNSVYKMYIMSQ